MLSKNKYKMEGKSKSSDGEKLANSIVPKQDKSCQFK